MVGLKLQPASTAGGVLLHYTVHDEKELLDALVLTQVLPTLHQVVVLLLIVPTNCDALGLADGGHDQHLCYSAVTVKGS